MTDTLTRILINSDIRNENGEQLVDFDDRNHDASDFASVSRSELKAMLEAAYRAGREARS